MTEKRIVLVFLNEAQMSQQHIFLTLEINKN
jgi:hypothetical protein